MTLYCNWNHLINTLKFGEHSLGGWQAIESSSHSNIEWQHKYLYVIEKLFIVKDKLFIGSKSLGHLDYWFFGNKLSIINRSKVKNYQSN